MAKHGNESRELLQKIRQEKIKGTAVKRFEDEFFALDLLKILYDDSEDAGVKTELLILLEEYGHLGLDHESIDQLVTSLLDIYRQAVDNGANWTFVCQALVTSTSLLVQLQQLESEICSQLIKELVAIVTTRVNQPDSQRLRCCACQCLIHMEEFQPGLLFPYLDEFLQLTRQERTQVYQDYALLSAKLMEYAGRMPDRTPGSPVNVQSPSKHKQKLQKPLSIDAQDLRQTAAMMLENAPLFTRCGLFRIMQSLTYLAQHQAAISPMMFKSLVLHQMPTMSCVHFHCVLYIQRQFEGEILTSKEEMDLVDRLCIMADHPCLNILHKLLACQWAKTYKQNESGEPTAHDCIVLRHRLKFYPRVFDPLDTQMSKLYMTSFCSNSEDIEGMETSILLGSLGYLHKLVWHTGSGRAAIALFKALYFMYTKHNSQAFGTDIQRFVRGLISEFPHFIPHSVDFIDSIHKLGVNSSIYVDTLALLHQQVVTATKEQIFHSFRFYLQILKKVTVERRIDQSTTLKFLCYLTENSAEVDDSSWKLGHDILEICRNLLTCHGTQKYFVEMGDLLYFMMTAYGDTDVADKAKFYYALLTGAADTKLKLVLGEVKFDSDSVQQALSSILPGTTEKPNLAKIIPLESGIFDWERISNSTSTCLLEKERKEEAPPQVSEELQPYLDHLYKHEFTVDIGCRLTLRPDSDFGQAHAITVHVDPSENFQPVTDVHVACLARQAHRDIVIKLRPVQPVAQKLTFHVDFACENKQTYTVRLPSIELNFQQFLLPLPWKLKAEKHQQCFSQLWTWVLTSNRFLRGGTETVKAFEITPEKFEEVHAKHLQRFFIGTEPSFEQSQYAIFLPPRHHILLRCQGHHNSRLVISVAMDTWTMLPHIDKLLDSFMS